MNRKAVVGMIAGIVLLSLVMALAANPDKKAAIGGGQRIGVIFIEGVITGGRDQAGLLGAGAAAQTILEQLKQAREDRSIKAVLLRINSPGGSAAASQEIGDEIDKIRKAGKVVVASMGDVAASGGYWIAAKADRIMAAPATITGSIGVIMETQNMQELFNKIGISPQTVKSGPYKDIGSPNRPLTPAEKNILQAMVNDIFGQFVDVVAKGRKIDRNRVLQMADGRIFTGRQARDNGLVDELGNYYDAVALTARLAGIKGEPELYELGPKTPFERLFGGIGSLLGMTGPNSGPGWREISLWRELLLIRPGLQGR